MLQTIRRDFDTFFFFSSSSILIVLQSLFLFLFTCIYEGNHQNAVAENRIMRATSWKVTTKENLQKKKTLCYVTARCVQFLILNDRKREREKYDIRKHLMTFYRFFHLFTLVVRSLSRQFSHCSKFLIFFLF